MTFMLNKRNLLAILMLCCVIGCDGTRSAFSKARDLATVVGFTQSSEPVVLTTGDTVTNAIGMKLAVIPPAVFQMGSPPTEEKRSGDERQHSVRLTQPILMGVYEVTQEEFAAVMGKLPAGVEKGEQTPVTNVSWEQAVSFCRKLSASPDEVAASRVYRLPTEAEWEFACRGLTKTATHFGDSLTSMQANFDGNYPYESEATGKFRGSPQPVGSFAPNALGLYDMHGNVWEWCSDWYATDAYLVSPDEDPTGPMTGSSHVIRGGSWYNFGYACRSAYRSEYVPPLEANVYGFRVVASLGKDTFEMTELPEPTVSLATSGPSPTTADAGQRNAENLAARSTTAAELPVNASVYSHSDVMVFLVAISLLFLSLIDPSNLFSWRNADVVLLFGATLSLAIFAKMDDEWKSVSWFAFSVCLLARLIWGQRTNSLPRPITFQFGFAWVPAALCMIVVAIFIMLGELTGATMKAYATQSLLLVAIGIPLLRIASRHVETRFALGLLLAWSLLVPLIPVDDVRPWIAMTLIFWGAVFINRPYVAGAFFAISLLFGMDSLLLLPLWSTYYLGKPRRKFLLTTLLLGVTCVLTLKVTVLTGQIQAFDNKLPNFLGSWLPASPAISLGATIVVALFAAFPQRRRTEAELAFRTTIVLIVVQCLQFGSSLAFISTPWVLLTLLGGIGNRRHLVRSAGIYPALGRLVQKRVFAPQRTVS